MKGFVFTVFTQRQLGINYSRTTDDKPWKPLAIAEPPFPASSGYGKFVRSGTSLR